jgi:adenylate cyclase
MTAEEEFMKVYGKEKVKFSSYYKYTFTFKGKNSNGHNISISIGGNHDEIYRQDVDADKDYMIAELEPYSGYVENNGKCIAEFYQCY